MHKKSAKLIQKPIGIFFFRGLCYEELGKFARAIEDYTFVIDSSPDFMPALAHRSRCHGKMGEFEKAVYDLFSEIQKTDKLSQAAPWNWSACLDDLLANKPQDPVILFIKGYNLQCWKFNKAEEYYNLAIEILPSEPAFYSHRSELHKKSGDLEKAINDISAAIKLAPENFKYYSKRADLLDRQGNYDEAINDLQKAIRFQPQDATLYQLRAIINMHKSENTGHDASLLKLSERDLKKAIKLDPEEPENYVKLGDIYYLLDLHNKAKRAYKRAMNTDSSLHPDSQEYLLINCWNSTQIIKVTLTG
jgi:tetratricopeptide (TPR) repeat protein